MDPTKIHASYDLATLKLAKVKMVMQIHIITHFFTKKEHLNLLVVKV